MATYVLVHGAWAGAWCWRDVGSLLVDAGHTVVTPTLTGLGERASAATPDVGVDTHVRDLDDQLRVLDGADVILVAHSYAGTVATVAVEANGDRVVRLVYVDAFVPTNGRSTFDYFPAEICAHMRASADEHGHGWLIPATDETLDLWAVADPAIRAWVGPRLTDFPIRCFEQPVTLTGAGVGPARTYLSCTDGPIEGVFTQFAVRARSEGWDHRDLAAGHAVWATAPRLLAEALLDLPEARRTS